MDFRIGTADSLDISDEELTDLLYRVYVGGGYTDADVAASIFQPAAVRARGKIIGARESRESQLAGMVIVVYPGSAALRLAQGNETEMHLLGVKAEYRGAGLGRALVAAAVEEARQAGSATMLLYTQTSMHAAHRVYESCGFLRLPDRDFVRGGHDFMVYEKALDRK